MIPAVSLTTWNSFPHRPLILTRQYMWTNIFIISIAKKLGLNLQFFKICPDRVYSPKGKKESSSQVKLVFLLGRLLNLQIFKYVCVPRICIVNLWRDGGGEEGDHRQ